MSADRYERTFRHIAAAVGTLTCSIRPDDRQVVVEWYDLGNVYGCYRSVAAATLEEALDAALAEIHASTA